MHYNQTKTVEKLKHLSILIVVQVLKNFVKYMSQN